MTQHQRRWKRLRGAGAAPGPRLWGSVGEGALSAAPAAPGAGKRSDCQEFPHHCFSHCEISRAPHTVPWDPWPPVSGAAEGIP